MDRNRISDHDMAITVEDKFIIFALGKGQLPCPSEEDSENLGQLVSRADLVPIFDLRGLKGYCERVEKFIGNVGGANSYAIFGKETLTDVRIIPGLKIIPAEAYAYETSPLPSTFFSARMHLDHLNTDDPIVPTAIAPSSGLAVGSWARWEDWTNIQHDVFKRHVASCSRNSLLVEFVMATKGDKVTVCPYHGHAIHDVETKRNTVLVGRPAVIARNTRATFSDEIEVLERLVSDPKTKERQIQTFLEKHPNFLREGWNLSEHLPSAYSRRAATMMVFSSLISLWSIWTVDSATFSTSSCLSRPCTLGAKIVDDSPLDCRRSLPNFESMLPILNRTSTASLSAKNTV